MKRPKSKNLRKEAERTYAAELAKGKFLNGSPVDVSSPSFFPAIQQQLGLKLEAKRGPVEILVIDHAETPSED